MPGISSYATLAAVNVNEHKAKKGGFDYLSWADAVDVLQQHFPGASWVVREWDGLPFTHTPAGGWVCVTVTVGGLYRTQWHPILDHKNKVIPADKLDVFAVNKSIQRCLAKAIALHGLGLYIFRGEDLPADDSVETHANPPPGPAQNSTPSQSSSRPSASGSGQPAAKAPCDDDRLKQDEAVALAVAMGISPEDLNAFCEANMSRIPLFDMAGGALVNLKGKIESGVVEQWALAQTGGAG